MKKTIRILAILLMVCAVGVFATTQFTPTKVETAYALTLKQGSRGETVKKLQQKLKNWGYYKASVDGIYGLIGFWAVNTINACFVITPIFKFLL